MIVPVVVLGRMGVINTNENGNTTGGSRENSSSRPGNDEERGRSDGRKLMGSRARSMTSNISNISTIDVLM